jgi:DNA repair protein RecO
VHDGSYSDAVPLEADEALCLRRWDWSETSQTAVLFARELGMLRCVAKGAKRAGARFSGGLEILTRVDILVSLRTVRARGEGLANLAAAEVAEVFPALRTDATAFFAGCALADALAHALTDGDPHPGIYDAALAALRGEDPLGSMLVFLWALLEQTGHAPRLSADEGGAGASFRFSPRAGGIISQQHASEGPVWKVRPATVGLLRVVARGGALDGERESGVRACKLLAAYFREVFACDPPAMKAWEERLADHADTRTGG